MTRSKAVAQPNIALIKYWGKRDVARNLPAVGSISITLSELQTTMAVAFDAADGDDRLTVNGAGQPALLPRVSACLDRLLGKKRPGALIDSTSNFPIAAGLASSASAFAALVVAGAAAAGLDYPKQRLAQLAGAASGSAARSLFGGFAELANRGAEIETRRLLAPADWPLSVVVAVTRKGPKAVGSTEAMEISRRTSPFYARWIESQDDDLTTARAAIEARDFAALAAVSEHNCLKMHSVMWASRPPMVYWNAATIACLDTVRALQADGVPVFFTIDAGPQVKAVCLPAARDAVEQALAATPGVEQILLAGLGDGAREVTK